MKPGIDVLLDHAVAEGSEIAAAADGDSALLDPIRERVTCLGHESEFDRGVGDTLSVRASIRRTGPALMLMYTCIAWIGSPSRYRTSVTRNGLIAAAVHEPTRASLRFSSRWP